MEWIRYVWLSTGPTAVNKEIQILPPPQKKNKGEGIFCLSERLSDFRKDAPPLTYSFSMKL